jgi:PadR family transcriptional regulator PadR
VGDASVYGTLRRLYAAGALTSYVVPSDEGPHRKYYGITPTGRAQLTTQTKDWETFAETVTALLSDTHAVTQQAQPEGARS